MMGGMTGRGGLPSLLDRVLLLARVKFCHVNVSRWGNQPSRARVTPNSRQLPLAEALHHQK